MWRRKLKNCAYHQRLPIYLLLSVQLSGKTVVLGSTQLRITSYNVCYTKLLRLFAYTPLFIQGALDKRPIDVGIVMLSLSLGWSCGSLALGRLLGRIGERTVV